MLFRAIAPKSTVVKVLREATPDQHGSALTDIFNKLMNPQSRDVLVLQVTRDKWESLLVKTQATPNRISPRVGASSFYRSEDVIWLTDHDGVDICSSDQEFDLFIHEE